SSTPTSGRSASSVQSATRCASAKSRSTRRSPPTARWMPHSPRIAWSRREAPLDGAAVRTRGLCSRVRLRCQPRANASGGRMTATVKTPLPGTFYRRPSPEAAPFVEEGDTIAAGEVVGLIEIMKTFHEIRSDADGVVAHFLVDNEELVDAGQDIIALEPS